MAYWAAKSFGSGFNQASTCSGLIGMTQRSCPAAATSGGGPSAIAAYESRSGWPGER
jgi:hypothetical protein